MVNWTERILDKYRSILYKINKTWRLQKTKTDFPKVSANLHPIKIFRSELGHDSAEIIYGYLGDHFEENKSCHVFTNYARLAVLTDTDPTDTDSSLLGYEVA